MNRNDTRNLLERYVRDRDEDAFREIVTNYLGLVEATALRRVNHDTARARDITQIVFSDLARQAARLSSGVLLGSWLYKHTCFVSSKLMRSEERRAAREKEASQMLTNDSENDAWAEVAPHLDSAILELSAEDQNAIILRFFEKRDLRSIGAAFSITDDAAQKRVQRAVEKLREALHAKGVTVGVTGLSTLLLSQATLSSTAASASVIASAALAAAAIAAPTAFLATATATIMSKAAIIVTTACAGALVTFLFLHKAAPERSENTPTTQFTSRANTTQPEQGVSQRVSIAVQSSPIETILNALEARLGGVNEQEITRALWDFWSQYDSATPQEKVQLRRAIKPIMALWPNASINLKKEIINTLGRFQPSTEQIVDLYLDAYKTEELRNDALNGIAWAGPAAAKATDLLIEHLRNNFKINKTGFPGNMDVSVSLAALSNIGPAASAAVPMLDEFLAGTNTLHRDAVLRAYWNITHDAEKVLPALTNALIANRSFMAADILGKMGDAAVPALDALQEAYASSSNPSAQLYAYEAIREVDRTRTPNADRIVEIMQSGSRTDKAHAAKILWDDFKNPDQVLPALTELITMRESGNPVPETKEALDLITEIGPPAEKILPQIQNILEDPIGDSRAWIAATNAWRAIAPDKQVPSKRPR